MCNSVLYICYVMVVHVRVFQISFLDAAHKTFLSTKSVSLTHTYGVLYVIHTPRNCTVGVRTNSLEYQPPHTFATLLKWNCRYMFSKCCGGINELTWEKVNLRRTWERNRTIQSRWNTESDTQHTDIDFVDWWIGWLPRAYQSGVEILCQLFTEIIEVL